MKLRALDDNGFVIETVIAVVAFLIAVIIGVLIWYKTDTALVAAGWSGMPAGGHTVWNSTNTTANSVWTLFPVVGLVLIAGVIIGTIMIFGSGRKM
jgi:hypothetical protein